MTRHSPQAAGTGLNKEGEKNLQLDILHFYDIPEALDIRDLASWSVARLLFLSGVSSLPVGDEPSASFDLFLPFLFSPLEGPKSKGTSRCLACPQQKRKRRKRTKTYGQLSIQESQPFRSCVVYIYSRVLLTWHACLSHSQIIFISLTWKKAKHWINPVSIHQSIPLPLEALSKKWHLTNTCDSRGTSQMHCIAQAIEEESINMFVFVTQIWF